MMNSFQISALIARRDLLLALRTGGGWLQGIIFFSVFVAFMAFGFGPDQFSLRTAASPTIWLATLFAVQLAASEMFITDLDDGTLGIFSIEHASLIPYVSGKCLGILIMVGLPLVIAAPIVLIMFGVSTNTALLALPSLVIGVITLSLAAIIASAINAALRGGGRFTAILAAPLSIPVLIFGIDATGSAMDNSALWTPEMQLLTAIALFLVTLVPGFSVLALRLGLE